MSLQGSTVTHLSRVEELEALAPQWNRLAEAGASPFLTVEWLAAWWRAFGRRGFDCLVLHGPDGSLQAGACLRRSAGGAVASAANVQSGDWDVVAADEATRSEIWQQILALGAPRLELQTLREGSPSLGMVEDGLRAASYRTVIERGPLSPYLELPATWDEFFASQSRNLRSQVRRRWRALEREGRVEIRTTSEGPELERDLETVFTVEASGWKQRAGSAIVNQGRTMQLYRDFAHAAARRGALRLHILEVGGVPVAVDYDCLFAGGAFLLKTGYDERYARFSPGLVLRAAVLRSSIEEGLAFYDFLGGPDEYKLRWSREIRPRVTLRAYRGPMAWPRFAYRSRVRPFLKARLGRSTSEGEQPIDD